MSGKNKGSLSMMFNWKAGRSGIFKNILSKIQRLPDNNMRYLEQYMENLRSDKEGYFHVLVLYRLFHKRNREHLPRVPMRYRNTRESLY